MNSPAANCPLTQKLDELFKPWNRSDAPGLVVGVAHRGQVIYRRGYGLASIEHAKANTPATRMRIGSTTKQVTAFGIMLLQEDGKLDIDQPVRAYLPELTGVAGEPSLLQLMRHTGGLGDPMFTAFMLNRGHYGHMPAGSSLQLISRFKERNFAPGERMAYSNTGYTLLTLVIERISGMPWEAFLAQRVFSVLGMNETTLLRSDMSIVPNMATLHLPQADGSWRRGIYPTDEVLGSGGVISTVDNMLSWLAHLRASPAEKKVGSAATWSKMTERPTTRSGLLSGYCLGIAREVYRGLETLSHAGATFGSGCQALTIPLQELDIVVMANRADAPVHDLTLRVIDVVLEGDALQPATAPAAAADYPAVQGRWYSASSRTLIAITARPIKPDAPAALILSMYNMPTAILQKAGDGLAMPDGPTSRVELRTLPEGDAPPARLDVHIAGELEHFERLTDAPPTAAELAPDVTGRYCYAEFGSELEIVLKDGKLFLDFLPDFGLSLWELEPFTADVLGCGALHTIPTAPLQQRAALTLDRRRGKVDGFWMSMDRVRNVRFDRVR